MLFFLNPNRTWIEAARDCKIWCYKLDEMKLFEEKRARAENGSAM